MASTAADDKGKRPIHPDDGPAAAAATAEAKLPSLSDPVPSGAKEKKRAAEEEATEGRAGRDGDGDEYLVLVTGCGTEVRFSRPAARMSVVLNGMMEEGCAKDRIPVPGVDARILRMVAAYCEKHGPYYNPPTVWEDRGTPFPTDLAPDLHVAKPDPDPCGLRSWDREFTAGVDNSTLFAIILAANHLEIEYLINLGCSAVADKIRGKTPDVVREILGIENDYTTEEEAEVRKQNAWAFED